MKILALAGSNSPNSINKALVSLAAAQTGHQATVLDMTLYDNLPLYSSERQQRDGFPLEIQQLYELIQASDGMLIASPEHNGSMPAVFKNVIDWLSRMNMKFFGQKPVLLMSTSPGPNGGSTNLKTMASLVPWWGAKLTGSFALGSFYQHYDAETQSLSETEQFRLNQELLVFETDLQAENASQPVLQAA